MLPLILMLTAIPATAQLHESVDVEGAYIKDILHPERINQLPKLSNFRIAETPLEYATSGVNANFTPEAPAIAATAWQASRDSIPPLGYLDLKMGSYLNTSLSFGIGIIRRPEQRLDLRLQHNSTSLWRPWGDMAGDRLSYDENLGLSWTRRFAGYGIFSAAAQYHVGYFNYYGIDPEIAGVSPAALPPVFPTQTLNDGALKLRWDSDRSGGAPTRWNASAAVRYFGYRIGTRETGLNLAGGFSSDIGYAGMIGADASLDILFYSGAQDTMKPDGYTTLSLSPYYKWHRGTLSLKAGVDIDLAFNADGEESDAGYSTLHASPEIRFDIATRHAGFFLHLLGGTELHTLAAMAQMDPYRNPVLESTRPIHTPVDGSIGVTLNPFRGFKAEIAFRYKASSSVPLEGWYMASLNYGTRPIPGLTIPADADYSIGMDLRRYSISGFGVSAMISYTPSRVFNVKASGSYTPQHDKTGIFNGLDRPRWILNAGFELSPIPQFSIGADYGYRGVRRIYAGYVADQSTLPAPGGSDITHTPATTIELASMRLPDITRLSAHAVWNVTPTFSLRFEADNLLAQRAILLPMTPTEGISLYGALQWIF